MADLTEEMIDRARNGERRAIEAVFREVHPAVCRVVRSLCGDSETADRVVDVSFRHALTVLPRWSSHVDPEHWFAHHALQTVRRLSSGRPDSSDDLLVAALPADQRQKAYVAFIRAIRRLPLQQGEAFILHHGQRLNARLLGVAMDCSTTAAETHLRAAEMAVRALVGSDFEPLAGSLRVAVVGLGPSPPETEQFVSARVGAWADRRSARRVVRTFLTVLVLALLAIAWSYRGTLFGLAGMK